jgi:EAL domain-containing protein (putative c-di-GMP-specific phosphodiesterase class I)
MQVAHVNSDFSLDRVVPFFQPIIDIRNQVVWRYECLARFINVEQQSFIPTELLYLIERRHSKANLTHTIFNCSANYFRHINMAWSINLSLQDMLDAELALFMRTHLEDYPNPKRISIEVATKNALDNQALFKEFAVLSRSLNLGITLDHFNPMSSDLNQILTLPVDAIKVSVRDMTKTLQLGDIARELKIFFAQANESNIVLIAEHIETSEELELIQQVGFQFAQGFYLSLPKAEIE